jgi:uncharacterized protein YdeI (YjbR/CyaY-like superfamily)
MAALTDAPFVHADTRAEWRAWLEANHATVPGAWLVTWRKGHGPVLDYGDAVQEALCFGWVDSTGGRFDDARTKVYFARRRDRSEWSASNKTRVERLIADGLMRPAGLAAIERAKANGMWTALDEVEQGIVPADLAAALATHPPAADRFAAFPWSARRALLLWIAQAKKPETRAARILETATRAARNERATDRATDRPSLTERSET